MSKNIKKDFILIFCSSILLVSCSQKKNIDLSNLPVIKQKQELNIKKENKYVINSKNNEFIQNLVAFKDKEKVLSQFRFGKIDPFSKYENKTTKLSSNFKLTGFLNTKFKKYVFVNYLGNEGAITENSIGGLNTNLLPKGAKVISIDAKAQKVTINHESKNYIFEL